MKQFDHVKAIGIVLSIFGSEGDELRFCRRLSADVSQGSLYLSRVMVTGRQIYPLHLPVLGQPDMLFRCEFRLRNVSRPIKHEQVEDLLGRVRKYQVLEAHYIDEAGSFVGHFDLPISVG